MYPLTIRNNILFQNSRNFMRKMSEISLKSLVLRKNVPLGSFLLSQHTLSKPETSH